MQPLQQPMVQCLDLSRPESISTAGYCADVIIQATRYPRPMLYSPAKGALVTYSPPGRSGVEEQQWLDSLSKPNHVTAKSLKSKPRTNSPQQQQQQQAPQQQAQPNTRQPQQTPSNPQQQPQTHQQPQQEAQSLPSHQQAQQQQQVSSHLAGLPPEAAAAVQRSTVKGQRAAEQAAFTAACLAERQLVSYPSVHSWGGRINQKHTSLCKMHAGLGCSLGAGDVVTQAPGLPNPSSSSSSSSRPLHQQVSSSNSAASSTTRQAPAAPAAALAEPPAGSTTTPSISSGLESASVAIAGVACLDSDSRLLRASRVKLGQSDAEVSAEAAQLGANADKMLKLLDRRKQKQQSKGQQQQQQSAAYAGTKQQQKHGQLKQGRATGAEHHMQDEPLCAAGLEYLRL